MALEQMLIRTRRVPFIFKRLALVICLALYTAMRLADSAVGGEPSSHPSPAAVTLTNILQVQQLAASRQETSSCEVRLEGTVLWISPAKDQLIFQDGSGGLVIKTDLHEQPFLQSGEKVRIEGTCLAGCGGITPEALIDNDGLHSSFDKSMTVFLSAGLHPISTKWFNGPFKFELSVDWMGPEMSRQRIPDTALFRTETNTTDAGGNLAPGLDYRCYEGQWERLPDFSQLPVARNGTATNFDLVVRTRDTDVGLVFNGYLKVPRAGKYTIWLTSDDGSKLSFDDLALRVNDLGQTTLPTPRRLVPGQLIPEEQQYQWSEVEGVVSSVSDAYGIVSVELTSETGHASLKFPAGSLDFVSLLLHSRIRTTGVCQTTFTVGGQTVPTLIVPDLKNTMVTETDPTFWADYPVRPIAVLWETNVPGATGTMVHVSGTVVSNSSGNSFVIADKSGRLEIETAQPIPRLRDLVDAVGWWNRAGSDTVLRNGFYWNTQQKPKGDSPGLPLLTKAVQVISLSRMEARRGYPVKIRGVVTALAGHDFFIQDSTWSVYAAGGESVVRDIPRIGDFWEIEGKSRVDFAPDIQVSRAVYLGPGNLPDPIHPTWDELVNGSLATKYVEIQGIATSVDTNDLILLTHDGKIKLQLGQTVLREQNGLEGALIRVRGVGSPFRDTNQMMQSSLHFLRLANPSVSIIEPAPSRPFELPLKQVSDLLFFDVRADALRRVRIGGQLLNEQQGEYFLMDNGRGFRFEPRSPIELQTGDLVDVVGFPDLSGPSPILREAVVRKTGTASLPAAQCLTEGAMLSGKLDATLVSIQARLIGLTFSRSEQVLELQAGTRNFVARLMNSRGALPDISPGSLLELTGVYAGQGGDRTLSRDVDSFELLLNSPSDISVLAHPSWWTFRHTIFVIGGMLSIIFFASIWIILLRRQVEERSRQLTSEIKSRELVERQRALEAERARIAQDLHDDLGATLTEIRFLSAVKSGDALVPHATRSQLMEVSEKSRQMVSSLDEIVWAINPANDLLPSMVNYLCHVTEEFLRTTKIRCRLDVDESLPPVALTSEVRHNLYLAVREALTNIAKHSQAAEAWLRIHWENQTLHIVVEDNGCGFAVPGPGSFGNGLSNMQARLEKIGGHFEYNTRPGAGTICRIQLSFK